MKYNSLAITHIVEYQIICHWFASIKLFDIIKGNLQQAGAFMNISEFNYQLSVGDDSITVSIDQGDNDVDLYLAICFDDAIRGNFGEIDDAFINNDICRRIDDIEGYYDWAMWGDLERIGVMLSEMTPSQIAKHYGLPSLSTVTEYTGVSPQTLNNWRENKPRLFMAVVESCRSWHEQGYTFMSR